MGDLLGSFCVTHLTCVPSSKGGCDLQDPDVLCCGTGVSGLGCMNCILDDASIGWAGRFMEKKLVFQILHFHQRAPQGVVCQSVGEGLSPEARDVVECAVSPGRACSSDGNGRWRLGLLVFAEEGLPQVTGVGGGGSVRMIVDVGRG
ncbi:hypothetical protein KSP40_PGU018750 [Platanthera guangdongensis]|uniref:Uncharacterized protein n=1 Tax=Platanthera guangdongensis TaxID=2320717 RepID=A0ABR2MJP2_9ASPA